MATDGRTLVSDHPDPKADPQAIIDRLSIWYAIGLGLVARLAALIFLPRQDLPDANAYLQSGRELFAGGQMSSHEYMPLYPVWTYLTGGGVTLRLADIGLSLATIWVVWRLALEIFGERRSALLAAFAMAVWPHAVFYSVSGLTETAYTLIVALGFLNLYRHRWWSAAVLLAVSVLVRPSLDIAIPVLILAFSVLVHREGPKTAGKRLGQYLAVYLVVMTPWWAHQFVKYDAFVRLNLGDGIVLYAGNNPMNKTGGGITGVDVDSAKFFELRHDPIARNEALKRAAFAYIREDPGRFLAMAGVKFLRFWRLWPYAPRYRTMPVIIVSLLSYGVMLAAAIWCLVANSREHWRAFAPIVLTAGYLSLVHMITIGSIRYRFPLEPFLIVLGTYPIARLLERLRRVRGGGSSIENSGISAP